MNKNRLAAFTDGNLPYGFSIAYSGKILTGIPMTACGQCLPVMSWAFYLLG